MRAFVRLLCTLLALALAAAGVLALIEIVAAAVGSDPVLIRWRGLPDTLGTTGWTTAGPRVVAGAAIVVGLLLLLAGLRRGKPSVVPLTSSVPDLDLTTTRRSLQRSLTTVAADQDGVSAAKVKVKRRKVAVRATARPGMSRDDVRQRVTDQVQHRLDGLSLASRRRVKLKLKQPRDKKAPPAPTGLSASASGTSTAGGSA